MVQVKVPDSIYRSTSFYQLLHGDRQHDLPFYLDLASERQGPILDVGIGTGRVALALARRGHEVVGIDSSPDMLAALAERVNAEPDEVRGRLSWQHGHGGSTSLARRFELIICPFNTIAHQHSLAGRGAFCRWIREHLAPGGWFAFDVLLPDPNLLRGTSSEIPWFRHPLTRKISRSTENIVYDSLTQMLTIKTTVRCMEDDSEPETLELRLRQLFPQEILLLLDHHGFEVLRRSELGDVIAHVCRDASPG